ncbi:unnamed protein product [Prorocentrum cordatum]|uniref:Uncharacterized protein n=1 Tax=Prorocentrum cordatum TaxID=2364126 RepID=A0ABN9RH87_9DINO|nr:unnamed protein product [Polarella glacialis]
MTGYSPVPTGHDAIPPLSGRICYSWEPLEHSSKSGQCLATLEGHMAGVTCLLAADGSLLSGSADRTIRQWDPRTGDLVAIMEGRTGIACLLDSGAACFSGMARGYPMRFPPPRLPPSPATPCSAQEETMDARDLSGKEDDSSSEDASEEGFDDPWSGEARLVRTAALQRTAPGPPNALRGAARVEQRTRRRQTIRPGVAKLGRRPGAGRGSKLRCGGGSTFPELWTGRSERERQHPGTRPARPEFLAMELVQCPPGLSFPAVAEKPRSWSKGVPDMVLPQRWTSAEELAVCLPGMLLSISSSPELAPTRRASTPWPSRGILRRRSELAPSPRLLDDGLDAPSPRPAHAPACLPGMVSPRERETTPPAPRALRGILRGRGAARAPSPKAAARAGLGRRLQLSRPGMVSLRRAVGALRGGAPRGRSARGRSAGAPEPTRERVCFRPVAEADVHHVPAYSSYYGVDPRLFEFDRKGMMRLTDEGIVEAFRRKEAGLPPLDLEMGDESGLSRSES